LPLVVWRPLATDFVLLGFQSSNMHLCCAFSFALAWLFLLTFDTVSYNSKFIYTSSVWFFYHQMSLLLVTGLPRSVFSRSPPWPRWLPLAKRIPFCRNFLHGQERRIWTIYIYWSRHISSNSGSDTKTFSLITITISHGIYSTFWTLYLKLNFIFFLHFAGFMVVESDIQPAMCSWYVLHSDQYTFSNTCIGHWCMDQIYYHNINMASPSDYE